jgi:hypothetical protein
VGCIKQIRVLWVPAVFIGFVSDGPGPEVTLQCAQTGFDAGARNTANEEK